MLFITNRQLYYDGGSLPRKVDFLLTENCPTQEVFFCQRNAKDDYQEIGGDSFFDSLRTSQYKQILLFIHGFHTAPESSIFQDIEIVQQYLDSLEKDFIQVIPIIYPCNTQEGIIKEYWNDQMAADVSGFSFKRVLDKFYQWSSVGDKDYCYKFINVFAHSMGNRVLRETLQAWRKYSMPQGLPKIFRNTFLVAADLNNGTLEIKDRGAVICDSSRNVVVYHANDDLALRASKIINEKDMTTTPRLGQTGARDANSVPANVYSVDCDDFNREYDFPLGHTYFLYNDKDNQPNIVISGMYKILKSGRFSQDIMLKKAMLATL